MEKRDYEKIITATIESLDAIAAKILTDSEYELEYQGLWIEDKRRYIINKINSPVS